MTQDEFRAKFTGGHLGDAGDYKQRLNTIADFVYDECLKVKGSATAAAVAALIAPTNKDAYVISVGGVINTITTRAGDVVMYNATTGLWEFFVDGATIKLV